jgi:para-nitrobenzyl esterase
VTGESGPPPPRAVTEHGQLLGDWAGPIAVFRGIPFAAPPVGPGRWRPPAAPAAWRGVRRATEFGPAPVQPQPRRDSVMFHANFADRRALVMSEDCLYLNVWTPDPVFSAGLPVLVWLHGGGNRFGYGSQDIHDGRNLASRGIIVVTLNYRLGALGFLAHPELCREDPAGAGGNWALLDIMAALRWVQVNIGSFGGNPAQVTLAGNSAGAAFACHLMAVPAARGLFARVIGQSSSGLCRPDGPVQSLEEAAAAGEAFGRSAGAAGLAALRAMSAVELSVGGHFGPVVDGALLVQDTQRAFAQGAQAPVPLLVGSNADEGSIYTPPGAAAELAGLAAGRPAGSKFHAAYPAGSPQERRDSARLFTGESRFVWPVWRWAISHARTSAAPVWVYRFGRQPPLPPDAGLAAPPDGGADYGAFHTAELLYVWDNLGQRGWPWAPADDAIAAAMSSAWARFAAAGDPNGGELPGWAAFAGKDDDAVMHFADPVRAGTMDRIDAMHVLDSLRGQDC